MSLLPHEKKVLMFLLQHTLYGTIGGILFGLLILWLDVGGLFTLLYYSANPALYTGILFFGLFITFGSVGMGIGIMAQGEDKY